MLHFIFTLKLLNYGLRYEFYSCLLILLWPFSSIELTNFTLRIKEEHCWVNVIFKFPFRCIYRAHQVHGISDKGIDSN